MTEKEMRIEICAAANYYAGLKSFERYETGMFKINLMVAVAKKKKIEGIVKLGERVMAQMEKSEFKRSGDLLTVAANNGWIKFEDYDFLPNEDERLLVVVKGDIEIATHCHLTNQFHLGAEGAEFVLKHVTHCQKRPDLPIS